MNYKSLASKGRYGDTELRNVAGRKSHVNKREANLIDLLGIKGEALTQALGAGTRNPETGMPEYHGSFANPWNTPMGHPAHHMNLGEGAINVLTAGMVDVSGMGEGTVVNVDADLGNIGTTGYDPSVSAGSLWGGQEKPDNNTTNTTNDFDPSSEDFRKMVTETGDYSQLIEGYDLEPGDTKFFDQPNMEQLGFIDEEFDISTDRISTGRDTLTENLRSATSSYNIGRQSAGLQAGRNLRGVRQQGATARSRSGLATSGTIDTKQGAAKQGIWQDYRQQQKTLSNQMTSAQSAFNIGQTGLDIDATAADLAKRKGKSAFWEGLESDFYTMAGNLG